MRRPFVCVLAATVSVSVVNNACSTGYPVSDPVEVIEEHDISGLNRTLEENVPTVDVVMFHSANTEVTWNQLKEEFSTADSIFRSHGVQLFLQRAFEVAFPTDWQGMVSGEGTNVPTDDMELDFYIPLSGLTVSWYERDEKNSWTEVTSPTSAISFPPYLFADRIPAYLKGVISFQRSRPARRTMAHELGHKLINVSHEGFDVCPQGSGTDVPGLMGYGESTEIFGGSEGRWHLERLLRSPFLYRMVDGQKVWNREYESGGNYGAPIYEGLIIEPTCPGS